MTTILLLGALCASSTPTTRLGTAEIAIAIDTDSELAGSFHSASETSITFHVRSEQATHGGDGTPHQIYDAMVSDSRGPLIVQIGGDELMDPSWRVSIEALDDLDNAGCTTDRTASFLLARELATALSASSGRTRVNAKRKALASLILGSVTDETLYPGPPGLAKDGTDTQAAEAISGYHHRMEIREKGAFHERLHPWIEHSATIFRSYTTWWSLAYVQVSCNHGSCATDPVMDYSCASWFLDRRYAFVRGLQGIPCEYWSFYGPTPFLHVCNDDTFHQYWTVKHNLSRPYYNQTCADFWLRSYAPTCF